MGETLNDVLFYITDDCVLETHGLEAIRARVLDALMNPGEGVLEAMTSQVKLLGDNTRSKTLREWQAGLQAIKEGR